MTGCESDATVPRLCEVQPRYENSSSDKQHDSKVSYKISNPGPLNSLIP